MSSLSLRIAVENGFDDAGAFCLTLHAVLVRAKYGQERESLAYGKAAISFFEKHGGSPLACPTYKVFSSHVAVWSTPFSDVFASFRQAVSYGIEYRDAEYLGFGCGELCSYSLLAGVSLSEIGSSIERYAVLVRKFRHELSTTCESGAQNSVCDATDGSRVQTSAWFSRQCCASLAGLQIRSSLTEKRSASMTTEFAKSDAVRASLLQAVRTTPLIARFLADSLTILLFHMLRLMIAVFFGDSTRAKESIAIGRTHLPGGQGLVYPPFFQLFEALTLYDDYNVLTPEQLGLIRDARALMDDLARGQPDNFLPLKLWLDAEQKRVDGPAIEALSLYDEAIATATARRMIHLAACMNERAASCLNNLKLGTGCAISAAPQRTKANVVCAATSSKHMRTGPPGAAHPRSPRWSSTIPSSSRTRRSRRRPTVRS